MSKDELNEHLSRFYRDRSLSPERVDRLLGEDRASSERAALNRRAVRGRSWLSPRQPIGLRWLLVACVVTALVSVAFYSWTTESESVGTAEKSVRRPDGEPPPGETPRAPADVAATARLVAVRVHADQCPRCPKIAPIYTELADAHADDPVLFVTLDVSSPARRREAVKTAAALDIEYAFASRFETGTIHLIDRHERTVLAVVRGRDDVAALEKALADTLREGNE